MREFSSNCSGKMDNKRRKIITVAATTTSATTEAKTIEVYTSIPPKYYCIRFF